MLSREINAIKREQYYQERTMLSRENKHVILPFEVFFIDELRYKVITELFISQDRFKTMKLGCHLQKGKGLSS